MKLLNSSCPINLILLEKNFCLRHKANIEFSSKENNTITCKAVKHFQINIDNAIKHLDHSYYYCRRFINLVQLKHISDKDLISITALDTEILGHHDLACCGHLFESFDFCH